MARIYKIFRSEEYADFVEAGETQGAPIEPLGAAGVTSQRRPITDLSRVRDVVAAGGADPEFALLDPLQGTVDLPRRGRPGTGVAGPVRRLHVELDHRPFCRRRQDGAVDAVAGRAFDASLIVHDRQAFPGNPIEDARLTDIGSTDNHYLR